MANPAEQAIAFISSTAVVVVAYFVGKATGLEPPDLNPSILALVCGVGGVILGGVMYVIRSKWSVSWTWIIVAVVVFAAIGFFSAFQYFDERRNRVGGLETGDPANYVTVADKLVPEVLRDFRFVAAQPGSNITQCGVELTVDISLACARNAAMPMHARIASETFFDSAALSRSRDLLSRWYFVMALCLIVSMFLIVDEYIHISRAQRRDGEDAPDGTKETGGEERAD